VRAISHGPAQKPDKPRSGVLKAKSEGLKRAEMLTSGSRRLQRAETPK
jgi:hypothetical protein